MYCCKCQNELFDCTCPDIQERLSAAAKEIGGSFVYRKCSICNQHYAKCKCQDPKWVLEGGKQ